MTQKSILWVLTVIIIAGGWYFYSAKGNESAGSGNTGTPAQEAVNTGTGAIAVPETGPGTGAAVSPGVPDAIITYTDGGFVPSSVTVKKGQTVRWMNNSGSKVWPASAVHPTHAVYPQKSSSDCLGSSFDACKGLSQGESWDFKFDYVGEWKFHNHLNASQRGAVTVTE